MGTKRRPGAYDCYGKAEDDEPMFVLLARDPLAPRLVERWAELREATRGPGAKVDEARACAAAMAVWAAEDRREEAASGTGGRDNEGGATSVVEAPSAAPDPPIAVEINWNPSWLMDRLLDAASAAGAHTEVVRRDRRPRGRHPHRVAVHRGRLGAHLAARQAVVMSGMVRRLVPCVAAGTAYVSTVIAANWAVQHYGIVPVGLGLRAPAGVYAAGLAFTLRDLLQEACCSGFGERAARGAAIAAIAVGAGVSALVSPALALASAVAFGVSEMADFAVYTPLRRRRWLTAVAVSNTVGLLVDSAVFLWLAFGSLEHLPGQALGKAWVTAATVLLLLPLHRRSDALLSRYP